MTLLAAAAEVLSALRRENVKGCIVGGLAVSGRETDAADLRSLAAVATEDEWNLASEAVAQIQHRGFARGRQLEAALLSLRDQTR